MKKIILSLFLVTFPAFAAVNTKTCVGCHGKNFEKSAMNKSKIVKEMTKQEVSDALIGYKNGTYGGIMKAVMKNQVAEYSDEDLKSTGIGKGEIVKSKQKEKVSNVRKVILEHLTMYAYKDNNICWVVDYKTHKTNLVDCDVIESRRDLKKKNLLPPVMHDMPNPLFDKLFK